MLLAKSGTFLALLLNFWLCSVKVKVGSWPCSHEQLVFSTISFFSDAVPTGLLITFINTDPILLKHPCPNVFDGGISPAIYLGKNVFVSFDRFESSLLPVSIPSHFTTSPARASAAIFVQTKRMVLVINGEVFIYYYRRWDTWAKAIGINNPVTELSNSHCCYAPQDPVCNEISNLVLAYDTGSLASESQIFYSKDGGYTFQSFLSRPYRDGQLLGVYNFASSSEIGMFLNQSENSSVTYYFTYGNLEYMRDETGTPFEIDIHENEELLMIHPPGLRGFIMLSTEDVFVSSSNNGLTTEEIKVLPRDSYRNTSLPEHDVGVCFVAATSTEVAVLTKNQLFYGSLHMTFSQLVHLGENNTTSPCDVLMFENTGTVSIIRPVQSNTTAYFRFQKCTINIQARLMTLQPPLEPCPVEILSGNFHNKMYYIDMKQELYFNVTFVPKPGTGAHPYVTVSNPHVLAFQAQVVQDGYSNDGNPKYSLQIKLIEQQFSGMSHQDFQNNSRYRKLSSITVDIYNKGIFCIDMHPLTALIAMDCPPKKHIRIVRTTTVCSKGLFEKRLLQNFTYSIDRNVYDPMFRGRKRLAQEDLHVTYEYDVWGCPLLIYYDSPWLPLLELWDNDKFVEYIPADFVLLEINGMHNYDYLLTEVEANCMSQAQNWITQMNSDRELDLNTTWTRINYESCKVPRGNDSLPSASTKYQVLNKNEKNRILFPQYNGIYVFKVIVVDTLYSYCELTTVFSVYVHGALPKSHINAGKTLVSFLVLIFGSMLMVYYFPKLLKENARMKSVWS
ncbi:cation channel sperm-associated auxiliary subunit delta-like [Elgaria multicarinata webbii]|uniref:cation channel sperm-associated auxiliary subunit delta-like n=1 Tax=Elgaria multicarinata webbii TaxID=159646 RepID=UPI002FCCE338